MNITAFELDNGLGIITTKKEIVREIIKFYKKKFKDEGHK